MKKALSQDPYGAVIQKFNSLGVRYVVVGMAGINFYAKDARETFATLDYDIFLDPTMKNAEKAIQALQGLGFSVGTSQGPLRPGATGELIRQRRTFIATTPYGVMVELLLAISGYPFSAMAKDAATFEVGGIPVRVGRLPKLLHSKKLAGRLKDRRFLERYQALLEEGEG